MPNCSLYLGYPIHNYRDRSGECHSSVRSEPSVFQNRKTRIHQQGKVCLVLCTTSRPRNNRTDNKFMDLTLENTTPSQPSSGSQSFLYNSPNAQPPSSLYNHPNAKPPPIHFSNHHPNRFQFQFVQPYLHCQMSPVPFNHQVCQSHNTPMNLVNQRMRKMPVPLLPVGAPRP